ncbi:MAG: FHA domain-containing protein [Planctomycetota bacterium]|nr:FHA domain-containing protein [Planctomycetota bacterium]
MPNFQLRIREPEREPKTITLGAPIVVGRARGADVTVSDKEAGRKQFRISVNADFVILESLGATNPTRVDDRSIQEGEQTTVETGSVIRIGQTEFDVLIADPADASAASPQPDADLDMTMAGGFRPGAPVAPQPTASDELDLTMSESPAPPPTPEADLNATMAGGFRPGAPKAPSAPPTPPATPPADTPLESADVTMVGGFRPGAGAPPPASPEAPKAPAAPPAAPASPAPPPPVSKAPEPANSDFSGTVIRAPTTGDARSDFSSWRPRIFVKGGGLKRMIELTKERSAIGRAESAEVLIPHEPVSERHAEVCFDGERWTLQDSNSTNGTVIDGELVRGESRHLRRNTLIAVGALRMVFLCNDRATADDDMRVEARALRALVRSRLLSKVDASEIQACMRDGGATTIAEIVLRDTTVSAADWATALMTARQPRSLLNRFLGLFGLGQG